MVALNKFDEYSTEETMQCNSLCHTHT